MHQTDAKCKHKIHRQHLSATYFTSSDVLLTFCSISEKISETKAACGSHWNSDSCWPWGISVVVDTVSKEKKKKEEIAQSEIKFLPLKWGLTWWIMLLKLPCLLSIPLNKGSFSYYWCPKELEKKPWLTHFRIKARWIHAMQMCSTHTWVILHRNQIWPGSEVAKYVFMLLHPCWDSPWDHI